MSTLAPRDERPPPARPVAERPVSVFLLDDHALMRRGIREVLETAGGFEVVGESSSAREAMRRIPAVHPDVMLLDVKLPDGSGVEVCRHVRSIDPSIHALMITTYDDEEARAASTTAGASGFVLKEVDVDDLVGAVRRVAAGGVLHGGAPHGEDPRDTSDIAGRLALLTRQELRVLELVADGLTNQQIGDVLGISAKTVKNHVTAVLQKLNVRWRTQAAVCLARSGHGTS